MDLAEIPLLLMLVGLVAYAVLGGADFGAGAWQLAGGTGERDKEIREHAHHAMGPVWETNHVWLIFVLVVCWTAYPVAFGSIMSTLSIPFFIAGIGIILRGTAYALRSGTASGREQRRVEVTLAVSSILTPFALGAVIGGIASLRVPVGNAEGDLVTSWLNPTSILVGVLAVVTAAYLAAVYLAADAVRIGRPDLAENPLFASNELRTRHQPALKAEIETATRGKATTESLALLDRAGVPCGPINTIDKALADPQIQSRNMVVTMHDPVVGELRMAGNPIKMSEFTDPPTRPRAPELDGDRAAILRDLLG